MSDTIKTCNNMDNYCNIYQKKPEQEYKTHAYIDMKKQVN